MRDAVSRRRFLVRLTALGSALIGGMVSVPALGFLLSPLFSRQRESWSTVGVIDRVPHDVPTAFEVDVPVGEGYITEPVRRIVYVVRHRDGRLRVLANTCSHMQCNVHWDVNLTQFLCPCHGGLYDIDGTNVGGPPPSPLPQWVHRTTVQPDGSTLLQIENRYESNI